MLRIVCAPGVEIAEQLSAPSFLRLGVEARVVAQGAAMLQEIHERPPDLVVLSAHLADGSGLDVCRQLGREPALQQLRTILALPRKELDRAMLAELTAAGCDDFIAVPAPADELYHQVAGLFGLPGCLVRSVWAELRLSDAGARGATFGGRVLSLTLTGARVALERAPDQPVAEGAAVQVRLSRKSGGGSSGTLVRGRAALVPVGSGTVCDVQFESLEGPSRRPLANLALWDAVAAGDRTQVLVHGDITENAEFDELATELSGTVEFDLSGVRYLNSAGVRHWVVFLEKLGKVKAYRFVRCSVAFVAQATMVSRLIGSGHVESFWAPYICESCEHSEQRLLPASTSASMEEMAQVQYRCGDCRGRLVLDDMPQRVLAFLESVG
jgi:CheY-like chemotaxis protein